MSAKKRRQRQRAVKKRRARSPLPSVARAPEESSSQVSTPFSRSLPGLLLFAVALGLRLLYMAQAADAPTFAMPIVDSEVYDRTARGFAAGRGITDTFFYQPFLYQLFLGAVYGLSGSSIVVAKLLQAVLGAAGCVLVFLFGSRLYDRRTGLVAGAITAAYAPLIFFDLELLATGLAALWSIVLVWMLTAAESSQRPLLHFAVGVCAALAVLTRPTFLPFLTVAWLWLAIAMLRRHGAPTLRPLGAAVIGFLLVVLPVAALSAERSGRFRFTPASGGLNLYLGNNPDTCETLMTRPGQEWHDRVVSPPLRAGYEGMWGNHDFFMARVRSFVTSHPIAAGSGLAGKALQFLSSREIPRNVDIYLFRRWSSLLAAGVWRVGDFGFPFGMLLPLAVLGVVTSWRRLPRPLLLFLLLYPAAVAVVFVSARYRVPVVPVAAIPAAAGIMTLIELGAGRRWRPLAVACAVVAAVLLIAVVPGPYCQEQNLEDEYWFLVGAAQLRDGDAEQAMQCFERAAALDPTYFEARYQLGVMLLERGDYEGAAENLAGAVAERPDFAVAHRDLGLALGRLERNSESLVHLERAVELAPLDARAHNYLGALLAQMGELEAALAALERSVSLDPDYRAARENRAWVRDRLARAE